MKKVLSIAVPSYNVEQYINKCLDSFSDSRLQDGLEVLIINDGSTDRTREIAESYVERFPLIFRLINNGEWRAWFSREYGYRECNGKVFSYC